VCKFYEWGVLAVASNRGCAMKRYQQLLRVLDQLEEKEREIENKRDEIFDASRENDLIPEVKQYDKELKDQLEEIIARIKVTRKQLEWIETDNDEWTAHFDQDGLYLRYKVIDLKEMPSFIGWLQLMNEEVQA